jgi:adenylyltransferase/sulfurtransferase
MLLPGFGETGQRKLLASSAFIVGCGALGTVIANHLARAGVGRLVIVDRDFIELTNLQRQVLFEEPDVENAVPKAEAARQKIARINRQVVVDAVVDDLDPSNLERLLLGEAGGGKGPRCDVVVDGVDNFETRFLVNDAIVKHGIPYVYGGAVGTVGMTYAVLPHTPSGGSPWERAGVATPCLRCIFEQAPPPGMNPTCDTAGVLGPTVAVIASLQANEAIKVLLGRYEAVNPTLTHVDTWENRLRQLRVAGAYEAGDCPCCKGRSFEFLAGAFASGATTLCGRNAVQVTQRLGAAQLDLVALARRLAAHGPVQASGFMVRATLREGGTEYEFSVFKDGRAIIKGTKEGAVARSLYAKYIGG